MVNAYSLSSNMERLDLKENIEKLVKSDKTYEVISKELKDQHLDCCGVSAGSVRRFCRDHQIKRSHYWKKN